MAHIGRWMASAVLLLGAAGCSGGDGDKPAPEVKSYDKSVAGVVEAANAFLTTLTADQKTKAQLDFTQDTATSWSNLPCGSTCRPGVKLGDLNATQLAAAKSVLKTAFGTTEGAGYERVEQIMLADEYLKNAQGSGNGGGPGGAQPSGAPGGGFPGGNASGAPGGFPGGPGNASGAPNGGPGNASGAPNGGPGGGFPGAGASGVPNGGAPGGNQGGPGGADGGYSAGTYFLAFLGAPSTTGTWQLDFGGHHLAVHLTYKAGQVTGASPFFVGVEPTSWTSDDGTDYAPMQDMKAAVLAMTGSLSPADQTAAALTESFSDVLVGPQKDGQFPAKKEGLPVGKLTADQKKLVLAAIRPWVANADDATATALMKTYENELDQTYIGWSGTLGLTKHADYVRIDGPSVWIEFVCQNGIVIQNQIHYHTVYRDHTRDYGGEFTFS